jgi:hypothetical protein
MVRPPIAPLRLSLAQPAGILACDGTGDAVPWNRNRPLPRVCRPPVKSAGRILPACYLLLTFML